MTDVDQLIEGDSQEQIIKMNSKIIKNKAKINMQNVCNP